MHSFKPDNTIIVFDIHGVLFSTDYRKVLHLLWTPQTCLIFLHLCNPTALWAMIKLWYKGAVDEEYLVYFTSRYQRLRGCKELLFAVANAQRPIQPMVDLVHDLKKQGYTLHILSNIGELMFDELTQRFPALFDQFDAYKVANQAEAYLAKPNIRMYQTYLQQHNPDNKQIIFIDDKVKNIKAAQQAGMTSLRFTTAQALAQQLGQLIQSSHIIN